MKSICIFFFLILLSCNLIGQELSQDKQEVDPIETFAIFVIQYTPIDSLLSIQTNLNELGYNILFEDIEVDSDGLLESMNCSFNDVCQKYWTTNSL